MAAVALTTLQIAQLPLGAGYGYAAVVIDGVALLAHVHLPQPETGQWDCSGVLAAACKQAGWYPFGTQDPRSITPADWDRVSKAAAV